MKDKNGRCPHCGISIVSTHRPDGFRIIGLILASGAAGFIVARLARERLLAVRPDRAMSAER